MRPTAERYVVFDAMGTLFDLSQLDAEFAALGASPSVRRAWFLRVLDSARTVTLLGEYVPFRELARAAVRTTLAQEGLDPDAGERVVERLATLDPYGDAEAALRRLADGAIASVILTNGSRANTENLLNRSALGGRVSAIFSTDDVSAYKPHARPYGYVSEQLGVDPGRLTLVAAHAWDVLGADAAGYETIWIDRSEIVWPFPLRQPGARVSSLAEAAAFILTR